MTCACCKLQERLNQFEQEQEEMETKKSNLQEYDAIVDEILEKSNPVDRGERGNAKFKEAIQILRDLGFKTTADFLFELGFYGYEEEHKL